MGSVGHELIRDPNPTGLWDGLLPSEHGHLLVGTVDRIFARLKSTKNT